MSAAWVSDLPGIKPISTVISALRQSQRFARSPHKIKWNQSQPSKRLLSNVARMEQGVRAFVANWQAVIRPLPTCSQESGQLKLERSQLSHGKLGTKLPRSEESSFQGQGRSEQAREEVAALHCGEEL